MRSFERSSKFLHFRTASWVSWVFQKKKRPTCRSALWSMVSAACLRFLGLVPTALGLLLRWYLIYKMIQNVKQKMKCNYLSTVDCCGVHHFCVFLFFILLCTRWQISGGWRRALYTHGGGGELSEGAAVHSLYKAICGQTGGRPVHFFSNPNGHTFKKNLRQEYLKIN